jgi:cytochrome c-type biogenesis protein CcmH
MKPWLVFGAVALTWTLPAFAVLPSEQLADPKLEARARAISQELRCVVCQNQTIDDSNADLAHDLRVLLRQRLAAGDSDQQAVAFIVKRYGDYVLLKPPFKAETMMLWLGPFLFLLAGGAGVAFYLRGRQAAAPSGFTPEEEARLGALLKDEGA